MMMLFANNASSRLYAEIDTVTPSIRLQAGDGAKFPTPAGDGTDFFTVTVEDKRTGQLEIMNCVGRSGDILNVIRGQEGTPAQAFALDATVSNRLTAMTMDFLAHAGAQGPQGEVGPVGPGGPKGDTGPMGPQGDPGPIGPQGIVGPVGPIGETGEQGMPGPIGPQGPAGIQGIKGDTGPIGPIGPAGMDGKITVVDELPPTDPVDGTLWWDSTTGNLFIWYDDGNSQQWVIANSITGPPGPPGVDGVDGVVTGDYLPLAGGTLTGPLEVPKGNRLAPSLLVGPDGGGLYANVYQSVSIVGPNDVEIVTFSPSATYFKSKFKFPDGTPGSVSLGPESNQTAGLYYDYNGMVLGIAAGGNSALEFHTLNDTATFGVREITKASTATEAGLNIPPGVAPTAPVDGDFWSDATGFYGRAAGVTVGPFGTGGGGATGDYLPLTGGTLTGALTGTSLRLTDVGDVSLTSTTHAFQVGPSTGLNIRADNNEIMAANNGASTTLSIQINGGQTSFGGKVVTPASTASIGSLGIPHGVAPTAPVNGDVWTTTAGLFARINGVTVGPLGTGGGGATGDYLPLAGGTMAGKLTIMTPKTTGTGFNLGGVATTSNNPSAVSVPGDMWAYQSSGHDRVNYKRSNNLVGQLLDTWSTQNVAGTKTFSSQQIFNPFLTPTKGAFRIVPLTHTGHPVAPDDGDFWVNQNGLHYKNLGAIQGPIRTTTTFHSGDGVPPDELGMPSDYYVDVTGGDMWGPKGVNIPSADETRMIFTEQAAPEIIGTTSQRLGQELIFNTNGFATHVRFWRMAASVVTSRTFDAYRATIGTLLGSTKPTVETAGFEGWVEAEFDPAIPVIAGDYVVFAYTETAYAASATRPVSIDGHVGNPTGTYIDDPAVAMPVKLSSLTGGAQSVYINVRHADEAPAPWQLVITGASQSAGGDPLPLTGGTMTGPINLTDALDKPPLRFGVHEEWPTREPGDMWWTGQKLRICQVAGGTSVTFLDNMSSATFNEPMTFATKAMFGGTGAAHINFYPKPIPGLLDPGDIGMDYTGLFYFLDTLRFIGETTIFNGPTEPPQAVGRPGDFYFDTAAKVLWGPKPNETADAGTWATTAADPTTFGTVKSRIGVCYTFNRGGTVSKCRFWRAADDPITQRRISAYKALGGDLIGQSEYSVETQGVGGWIEVAFDPPMIITMGQAPTFMMTADNFAFTAGPPPPPATNPLYMEYASGYEEVWESDNFPSTEFNENYYYVEPMFHIMTPAVWPIAIPAPTPPAVLDAAMARIDALEARLIALEGAR